MNHLARAMPAFLRWSLAAMVQYRGEIILWAIWGVVYPAIATAMWSAAAAGRVGGGEIAGYGPHDFAAYFLMTMVVGHLATAWDLYEMGWQVQSGRMSTKLLRPMLPIWQAMADNLAYKVLTMIILLPIWIAVAIVTRPAISASPSTVMLGSLAAILGATLNFLWGYNVALAAFWMTRTDAIGEFWHGLSMFLGGRLAPLTILPLPIQWVAVFFPFKWFLWFPSVALIGKLSTREILAGLGWQLFWLVLSLIVFRLTWRAAIKRYTAVGA